DTSVAEPRRTPLTLLAGANDYRTVDPSLVVSGETGDAWLGVFKSIDGGLSWTSTLLPGCPYNVTQCTSPASPVRGFQAASDPVVRSEEHTSELQSRVDLVC